MNWLKRLFQKSRAESDLDRELHSHIEQQIATHIANGLSPAEGRRQANLEFGGLERVKEEVRATRWETHLENLVRDFRYAVRNLRKDKKFALVAILALALGIGSSTAIFSIVYSVILNPFPYANVSRLATFRVNFGGESDDNERAYFAVPEFLAFKEQNHVFDDLIGLAGSNVMYRGKEGVRRFAGGLITANAFEILGVKPLLGRPLTPQDVAPTSSPAFVMSYQLWITEFNGDPKIIGTTFILNDEPRTLAAIMPARFRFGQFCEVWIPVALQRPSSTKASLEKGPWFTPVGLLKKGVTVQMAAADLSVIEQNLAKEFPAGYLRKSEIQVKTLVDSYVGSLRGLLLVLVFAVAMLLFIACSNVANLLLSKSTAREKEMAIRTSIGASRSRLIGQLLIESFVLAFIGCLVGCVFAYVALRAAVTVIPDASLPAEAVISMSPLALIFALAVTFLTTVLCGLVPALHTVQPNLNISINSGKGSQPNFRHGKLRAGLVIAEVALSLVLLIASGLMVRTVFALERLQLGFNPQNIFFAELHHSGEYSTTREKNIFYRTVLDQLAKTPDIRSATLAIRVPPSSVGLTDVFIPGRPEMDSYAESELCSENYAETLGIPLLRGRFFTRDEIDSARPLVVVNQTFARTFFAAKDPVGQKVKFPSWEKNYDDWPRDTYFEIIGVIADAKNKGLQQPTMSQIYLPYTITATSLSDDRILLARSSGDPELALAAFRRSIHEMDSSVAVTDTGTVAGFLSDYYLAVPRFSLIATTAFSVAGLSLVLVGIFSVMAYTVSLRTHEIGIRMAMGAQRQHVLSMVLKNGLLLISVGILIGLAASIWLTRFLSSQIWGISPTDPWTFATVIALVIFVGLAACLIPAHTATKVDPLIALRYE